MMNDIAHLDWDRFACQTAGCKQVATHIVEWHPVNVCEVTGHPRGDRVEICCIRCLRWYRDHAQLFEPCICQSCGRKIVHTLLRSVSPIEQARETSNG